MCHEREGPETALLLIIDVQRAWKSVSICGVVIVGFFFCS